MATLAQLRRKAEPQLEMIAQAGFEKRLVRACFDNLQASGPLRFNNFAYALREFLRHVFHRLGPDESVKSCSWFKPDSQANGGITRSHRAKYMIQGGLSDVFVQKKLAIDVNSFLSDLSDTFKVLNNFTHIGSETFGLPTRKVEALAGQCLDAAESLVNNIASCRFNVLESLGKAVDDHLLREAISDTVEALDELATHYLIDEISVDSSKVVDLGAKSLILDVAGSVEVELQYGSSSDVRNGMGAVMSESFPFSAKVHVKFERPLGKHAKVKNFKVDTRNWYE